MYECKIAEKLVELRIEKGVTQDDVAHSLSVSNKTISKWETGASEPDLTMLIGLATYYGVSTDALLGMAEEKGQSVRETVCAEFQGVDRKDAVLKAFELVKSIIPATYETISACQDDVNDNFDVFPKEVSHFYRSQIAAHEFFEFVASSEDVNVAVMLLRNKSNFSWLKDAQKQQKIVRFFRFLSHEDTLSVLYFIHSTACSESFTADYVSKNTGVAQERVSTILDEFCHIGECRWVTAHLEEGEVTVYECFGDGIVMSAVTLAYERMCGRQSYDYNFNGRCKMII